jgi:hypothetical protein
MLHNLLDSFYNTSLTLVFFSLAFLLLFIGFKGYKSNNKNANEKKTNVKDVL